MKRDSKRKGFTLVELLIVIVVIGILSAMMMISSTEAVSSAKAANIIGNMRALKTAALAYYVDNVGGQGSSSLSITISAISKYLSGTDTGKIRNSGCTYTVDGNTITCTVGGEKNEKDRVMAKLTDRAKALGMTASSTAGTLTMDIFDKGAN